MRRIVLDEEDQDTTSSTKIVPKAVSQAVITQQPWDPIFSEIRFMHMHGGLSPKTRQLR